MGVPKMILAGAGEKCQYLVHEFNDNTIRFVLRYPGLIDPDILCTATKTLIERVDILHGTFFNDVLNAYWKINEEYEESSYFQYVLVDGDPVVTAQSLSLLPVLPDGKAQLRCYLVQNETESAIAVNMSHLCVDGGDGKYLLFKLVESYNLILSTNAADDLEVKNGSRAPEQIYDGITPRELRSLLKMPGSDVKSEFRFVNDEPGRANMVRISIPEPVMTCARKRAKQEGATANDLLLTAVYRAYAALPDVDETMPMSVMSMIDLRRHCDDGESDGLCNMSGTFPTTLRDGVQGNFSDTLAQVAEQTRAAKDDPLVGMDGMPLIHGAVRTMPMRLLLLVAGKVYGSLSLGLTNLGNMDCKTLALGELVPNEGLFGGPLKKKPGMQISAASFDGNCSLCIVGQYTKEDAVLLNSLLDRIAEEIANYAKES